MESVSNSISEAAGSVAKKVIHYIPEPLYGSMGKQFMNIICETLYHDSDESERYPKKEILKIVEDHLIKLLTDNEDQMKTVMNQVIMEETRKYIQPFLSSDYISLFMMQDILSKHFDFTVGIIEKAHLSIHEKNENPEQKVSAIIDQLTNPVINTPESDNAEAHDDETRESEPTIVLASDDKTNTSIKIGGDAESTTPPADDKTAPADDKTAPADDKTAPADDKTAPADGNTPPADGKTPPADGIAVPTDGTALPTDGTIPSGIPTNVTNLPKIESPIDNPFEDLAKESVIIFKEKMNTHVKGEEINDVIKNALESHLSKPEGRQMFLRQLEPILRSYVIEYTNKGKSLAMVFGHLCSIQQINTIIKNEITKMVNDKLSVRILCNNIKNEINKTINELNPLNDIYDEMLNYFEKREIIAKINQDVSKTICTNGQLLENNVTGVDAISSVPVVKMNANTKAPEVKAPEVKAPEVKAPEVKAPEVKAPEVKAPEVKAPEVKAPEVKAPEVKAAEVKAPEVNVPEVKEPDDKAKDTKDDQHGGKLKRVSKTKRRRRTFRKRNTTQRYL